MNGGCVVLGSNRLHGSTPVVLCLGYGGDLQDKWIHLVIRSQAAMINHQDRQ